MRRAKLVALEAYRTDQQLLDRLRELAREKTNLEKQLAKLGKAASNDDE